MFIFSALFSLSPCCSSHRTFFFLGTLQCCTYLNQYLDSNLFESDTERGLLQAIVNCQTQIKCINDHQTKRVLFGTTLPATSTHNLKIYQKKVVKSYCDDMTLTTMLHEPSAHGRPRACAVRLARTWKCCDGKTIEIPAKQTQTQFTRHQESRECPCPGNPGTRNLMPSSGSKALGPGDAENPFRGAEWGWRS